MIVGVSALNGDRWYAVRSVFRTTPSPAAPLPDIDEGEVAFEERITLWHAGSFDAALEAAEVEALAYAEFSGAEYLADFGQAYQLADVPPRNGTEVFSLIRYSALDSAAYIDRFFDTGRERQG
jgi:hypothetical protein